MQNIRWTSLLPIVVGGLFLTSCANYKGDGKFTSKWPPFAGYEYMLELPEFDLGQPTSVTFNMSGMPSRYYTVRLVYRSVLTDAQFEQVDTEATIEIVRADQVRVLYWHDRLVHDPDQPAYLQTWRGNFSLVEPNGWISLTPNEYYSIHVQVSPRQPVDFPVRASIRLTSVLSDNPSLPRDDE